MEAKNPGQLKEELAKKSEAWQQKTIKNCKPEHEPHQDSVSNLRWERTKKVAWKAQRYHDMKIYHNEISRNQKSEILLWIKNWKSFSQWCLIAVFHVNACKMIALDGLKRSPNGVVPSPGSTKTAGSRGGQGRAGSTTWILPRCGTSKHLEEDPDQRGRQPGICKVVYSSWEFDTFSLLLGL